MVEFDLVATSDGAMKTERLYDNGYCYVSSIFVTLMSTGASRHADMLISVPTVPIADLGGAFDPALA